MLAFTEVSDSYVRRMASFMYIWCNVAVCNIILQLLLICNSELCRSCMKRFRNLRDRKAKQSDISALNARVLNYE
jgi:hypothetical protein